MRRILKREKQYEAYEHTRGIYHWRESASRGKSIEPSPYLSDSTAGCYLATPARSTWCTSLFAPRRLAEGERERRGEKGACHGRADRAPCTCGRVSCAIKPWPRLFWHPENPQRHCRFFSHNRPNLIPRRGAPPEATVRSFSRENATPRTHAPAIG